MGVEMVTEEQDNAARLIGVAMRGLLPFAREADLAVIEHLMAMVLAETERVERNASIGKAH